MSAQISVVITCYNQARYLGAAIASVLAQTYPPTQIIVMDDGSVDDSQAVAANYSGVQYVRQLNQGVAAARNNGFQQSTGEFVVFMDGDDRLMPSALETNLNYLRAAPACAFAFGSRIAVDAVGVPLPGWEWNYTGEDHYLELLLGNQIHCPAQVMHRRAAFESVGGFREFSNSAEDYDLYLRLAQKFPLCGHREVIAEYRVHGTNGSHNHRLMMQSTLTILHAQRKFIKGNRGYEQAYKTGVRRCRESFGDKLFWSVVADARARQWISAMQKTSFLLRCSPRALAKNLGHKINKTRSVGK